MSIAWWRGHTRWINCPEVQTEIKCSPADAMVSVCACVSAHVCCKSTLAPKSNVVHPKTSSSSLHESVAVHFRESGSERSHISAFTSLSELDWHEAIYLSPGLLVHRRRRRGERRGLLKSLLSRMCDQWQPVAPQCLSGSFRSSAGNRPTTSPPSTFRKDNWGVQRPHLVHLHPLHEKGTAIASAIMFY